MQENAVSARSTPASRRQLSECAGEIARSRHITLRSRFAGCLVEDCPTSAMRRELPCFSSLTRATAIGANLDRSRSVRDGTILKVASATAGDRRCVKQSKRFDPGNACKLYYVVLIESVHSAVSKRPANRPG